MNISNWMFALVTVNLIKEQDGQYSSYSVPFCDILHLPYCVVVLQNRDFQSRIIARNIEVCIV